MDIEGIVEENNSHQEINLEKINESYHFPFYNQRNSSVELEELERCILKLKSFLKNKDLRKNLFIQDFF